jgi:dCTP diphosphatase
VTLEQLALEVERFMNERDWRQFHNPKDLAVGMSLECAELLEHFLWQNGAAIDQRAADRREAIQHEMADVAIYLLELASVLHIDLGEAILAKLKINATRYPPEKARGSSRKYTELEGSG